MQGRRAGGWDGLYRTRNSLTVILRLFPQNLSVGWKMLSPVRSFPKAQWPWTEKFQFLLMSWSSAGRSAGMLSPDFARPTLFPSPAPPSCKLSASSPLSQQIQDERPRCGASREVVASPCQHPRPEPSDTLPPTRKSGLAL